MRNERIGRSGKARPSIESASLDSQLGLVYKQQGTFGEIKDFKKAKNI